MVIDYTNGSGEGANTAALKTPFWSQTGAAWCRADGTNEATFVRPGRPLAWRRLDAYLAADWDEMDQDADIRVIATVRQRALAGDPRALGLAFRASRGFARPVDLPSYVTEREPIAPEVAAAMIDAGLAVIRASEGRRSDDYPV